MLPGIGITEIIVIGVVAVLLFGAKLPEVARNFGRSYSQFRKGLSDLQANFRFDDDDRRHTSPYTSTANARLTHYKDGGDRDDTSNSESSEDDDVPRFIAPSIDPESNDNPHTSSNR